MKPIESKRIAMNRRIALRFPDFDGFNSEYATNLSMTGMFVRSNEPQKAGTPVSFEFRLEDGVILVQGSGWVVWSRDSREAPDRPAGMGIEFTELDHKSRRLVRWMILNQLSEGEKPFEVRNGTANAPATDRLVSRPAAHRSRRAGILTAVLMFSALAALVYWGSFRGSAEPSVETGRMSGAKQAAGIDAPVEASGARAAETAPEASVALEPDQFEVGPDGELESATAAVESVVRSWVGAWSRQDVDGYLGHYASDFEPEGGLSREQWSDYRRQRLTAPKSIRVAVTRLETRLLSDDEARVSFLQTYRSDGYTDTVDKVLTLARGEDGWAIRREVAD